MTACTALHQRSCAMIGSVVGPCVVDDRTIFLDLCGNHYFCLSSATDRAFRASLPGEDLLPKIHSTARGCESVRHLIDFAECRDFRPAEVLPEGSVR